MIALVIYYRIIADNGVESRYPFLDESVVSFLNSVPVWLKMNLNYPRGIGEKLLLRLLAYKLGLHDAAALPKRAIQFGSRIARIENSKERSDA
ncbi:Asparagine synthetase domain-containing protein 1 [Araneus ventricosus]|uniref:Asparagine synthetase domain-containing protein 1 n=1 Tax=Araneus ventricosus TaxID=182803 RepID=A0A4Y2JN75_ARAVE|nr:Asparagine synthetase domain-containing protein 1 [Araneus ventricosus]